MGEEEGALPSISIPVEGGADDDDLNIEGEGRFHTISVR